MERKRPCPPRFIIVPIRVGYWWRLAPSGAGRGAGASIARWFGLSPSRLGLLHRVPLRRGLLVLTRGSRGTGQGQSGFTVNGTAPTVRGRRWCCISSQPSANSSIVALLLAGATQAPRSKSVSTVEGHARASALALNIMSALWRVPSCQWCAIVPVVCHRASGVPSCQWCAIVPVVAW